MINRKARSTFSLMIALLLLLGSLFPFKQALAEDTAQPVQEPGITASVAAEDGYQVWSIRRFVVPETTSYNVFGWWYIAAGQPEGADATTVRVYIDGVAIATSTITTAGQSNFRNYNIGERRDLEAGTVIDIIISHANESATNSWGGFVNTTISETLLDPVTGESTGVNYQHTSESNFHTEQGTNGWYYGYAHIPHSQWDGNNPQYDSATDFQEMVYDSNTSRWQHPDMPDEVYLSGQQHMYLGYLEQPTPIEDDETYQIWNIRRWVSEVSGSINITGYWRLALEQGAESDGTGLRIFVDGQQVHTSHKNASGSTDLNIRNIPVEAGTIVDFVITPGAADSSNVIDDGAVIVIDIWSSAGGNNSVDNYSDQQGGNGWYYGYADIPRTSSSEISPQYDSSTDFQLMEHGVVNDIGRWYNPDMPQVYQLASNLFPGFSEEIPIDPPAIPDDEDQDPGDNDPVDPEPLQLTFSQAQLGNIFSAGLVGEADEEVVIPIETNGDIVEWVITDYWGETVASGSEQVVDGEADITPDVGIGFFELSVESKKHGADTVAANTTFAVVRHTDVNPETARFGVQTHFAQHWNIEMMPLITKAGIYLIRDEHYWYAVERERGVYHFPDHSDAYMEAANEHGIHVLPIMSFTNSLYDVDPIGNLHGWTIRRWVSPDSGIIDISASWELIQNQGANTDGTGFRIFVDGEQVAFQHKLVKEAPEMINLSQIEVEAGTAIDFVITPGDADAGNSYYDGAIIDITVSLDGIAYNSIEQFSDEQGSDQWYYGYANITSSRWNDYDPDSDFREMMYDAARTNPWYNPSFTWSYQSSGRMTPDIRGSGGAAVAPYTDDGREGYANYGKAILDYFTEMEAPIPAIEVWNEYNGSFASGPVSADKPYYYTEMLKKSHEVLKAAYPEVPILGAAPVMIPTGYLEAIFEHGALDYMDAVVIHPYVQQWDVSWPELVWTEINDLNGQIMRHNDGELKPIWTTEFGMSSRDRIYQSNFNMRQLAILSSFDNIEFNSIYMFMDDGSFPFMGLVKNENAPEGKFVPNPAYVTTANMIHQLNEATPLGREIVSELSNLYIMKFIDDDGQELRVAWSADEAGETAEFYTDEPLTIVDIVGGETLVQPVDGKVSIPLGEAIVYVKGEVGEIKGTAVQPVADSFISFSDTQGGSNWYYGYYDNGEFIPMHYTPEFTWNWQWQGGEDQTLKVTQPGGYPSRETVDKPAVRRWISTVDGNVRVEGLIGYSLLDYSIQVDGEVVYQNILPSIRQTEYEAEFAVQIGSQVDFVLQHQGDQPNRASDKTVFTARIFDITEYPVDPEEPDDQDDTNDPSDPDPEPIYTGPFPDDTDPTDPEPVDPEEQAPTEPDLTDPVEPEVSFTDLDDTYWAYSTIILAAQSGIIFGYPDGTVRPDNSISRGEIAVLLARALDLPDPAGGHLNYADAAAIPFWAQDSILQLAEAGLMLGNADGTFNSAGFLTRNELAAIAVRAAGLTADEVESTSFVDDEQIPLWAKPYVQASFEEGLLIGQGNGVFAPDAATTRAEALTLILRLLDYIE